jgi:hypothetical protein
MGHKLAGPTNSWKKRRDTIPLGPNPAVRGGGAAGRGACRLGEDPTLESWRGVSSLEAAAHSGIAEAEGLDRGRLMEW